MKRATGIPTFLLAALLVLVPITVASGSELQGPPEHVLQAAHDAIAMARELAADFRGLAFGRESTGRPDHAQGGPDHATGLARAQEALATAAAQGNGNGNAYGRGHGAEVIAQLLTGGSPSELPNHGQQVSAMVAAFNALRINHPGLNLGS